MNAVARTTEQAVERSMLNALGYLENLLEQRVWVDPREAYRGPNGEDWISLTQRDPVELTDPERDMIREECRRLAKLSPWGKSGLANRRNYIVGWGHVYSAVGRSNDSDNGAVRRVQAFLEGWTKAVAWGDRQRDTIHRGDRDGEVFLRRFPMDDGILRVRYVRAEAIQSPTGARDDFASGVLTDPDDEETVLAYGVRTRGGNHETIGPDEIQHRKFNVDTECRRGLSMLFPVRPNLWRSERLLRNMNATAEVQAAIAMIRKHEGATASAVRSFVQAMDQARSVGHIDSADDSVARFPPASIIDASKSVEYTFPHAGVDPSKFVACLQADLRAVCAAWTMPEFMVTADASNGNYSSILVAEGPVSKAFECDQQAMVEADLAIIQEALRHAADHGGWGVTHEDLAITRVVATPPPVSTRDGLKDAQISQILGQMGWLSPQTGLGWFGLKHSEERVNLDAAEESGGGPITNDRPGLPPLPAPGA